jgi:hypothetical protein
MSMSYSHNLRRIALAAWVALAGCDSDANRDDRAQALQDGLAEVSFYGLIANAQNYDGKAIAVHGVLDLDARHRRARLFVSSEAKKNLTIVDSLGLTLPPERWSDPSLINAADKYVVVTGVFHASLDSATDAGTLTRVEKLAVVEFEIPTLESASKSYRATSDYYSLRFLSSQVEPGIARRTVESWLGAGTQSEDVRFVCYESDGTFQFARGEVEKPIGLLVEYRRPEAGGDSIVVRAQLNRYDKCLSGAAD